MCNVKKTTSCNKEFSVYSHITSASKLRFYGACYQLIWNLDHTVHLLNKQIACSIQKKDKHWKTDITIFSAFLCYLDSQVVHYLLNKSK